MSLLNFRDNSNNLKGEKKTLKLLLGIGALVGVIALGQTLAASINLNGGGPVEFGQGVTQTTSCDSEILVTPYSSFVNGDPGAFMFSALMLSQVDTTDQSDSGEGCAGKAFLIKLYEEDGTPINVSYTISISDNGTFSSNDGDINASGENGTNSSVTLDFPSPTIDASEIYRITIESSSTQAAPTGYEVGDIGPGGGIVFYVSTDFFTSAGSTCDTACKYLEVAPATWQSEGASVADDSIFQWLDNYIYVATGQDKTTLSTEGYSDDETANWKIGQGLYNTSVMKVPGSISSTAQAAVLAYAGGSVAGQWFIPSMNELNELCKYARGQTTGNPKVACDGSGTLKTGTTNYLGGFMGAVYDAYWSSTEYGGDYARVQSFDSGLLNLNAKHFGGYVRPIRAF